jgi:hypothetical protein
MKYNKDIDGHYYIGSCYLRDGRVIYIESGCYTDPTYGRLSNHWHWRKVNEDGTLGRRGNGYGETNIRSIKFDIGIKIALA